MQARLQEIKDRLKKITGENWFSKIDVDSDGQDVDCFVIIPKLKHYHNERVAYVIKKNDNDFIANSPADIKFLLDALEQSQKENKLLQRKFSNLNKIVDEYQNELIPDYRSRAEQAQDRERVLRDFIDTQFCQNFKKYGKTTNCHHPDNGLCDKYYDCMALDKALKEDKS